MIRRWLRNLILWALASDPPPDSNAAAELDAITMAMRR